MITSTVAELFTQEIKHIDVEIKGWVKSFRANRFIALNDGSTLRNIQCVVDFESMEEALLKRITTGAAVHIKGSLVESQGKGQDVEIQVSSVEILGDADPELVSKTILQPKTLCMLSNILPLPNASFEIPLDIFFASFPEITNENIG